MITTAARAVHVEHVGAAEGAPAWACAALRMAETLQALYLQPGPPTQDRLHSIPVAPQCVLPSVAQRPARLLMLRTCALFYCETDEREEEIRKPEGERRTGRPDTDDSGDNKTSVSFVSYETDEKLWLSQVELGS